MLMLLLPNSLCRYDDDKDYVFQCERRVIKWTRLVNVHTENNDDNENSKGKNNNGDL